MKCIIMRHVYEGEGREILLRICDSFAEAEQWIEAQEGEYFKSLDCYIKWPRGETSNDRPNQKRRL
jgi:hypothetical protein